MKTFLLSLIAITLFATACDNKKNKSDAQQSVKIDMSDFYMHTNTPDGSALNPSIGRKTPKMCYTMHVLNKQLETDSTLEKKMYDIEYNTRVFIQKKQSARKGNAINETTSRINDSLGIINIPVYIHVIYSNLNENISDAQIESQIRILNEDFRKINDDVDEIPSEFTSLAADSEITFTLAQIFRNSNTTTEWGTNNVVKSTYPPVTPETHLNIWVCNIGGGILGYAQFPGGNSATDGIVVSPQYFGDTGMVSQPFNRGRTTTHEVGHYLNLRHIWGDGGCTQDDFVTDTPTSDRPNYGCPAFPIVNCESNDMTMNYMDYVNDACMHMFTEGQKTRMRAIFAPKGPRAAMAGN